MNWSDLWRKRTGTDGEPVEIVIRDTVVGADGEPVPLDPDDPFAGETRIVLGGTTAAAPASEPGADR